MTEPTPTLGLVINQNEYETLPLRDFVDLCRRGYGTRFLLKAGGNARVSCQRKVKWVALNSQLTCGHVPTAESTARKH